MAATGVAAIMVGRAALKEPDVFRRLRSGAEPSPPDADRARRLCRLHLDYLWRFREQLAARFPGDRIPDFAGWALSKLRTHLFRYFGGCAGAAALRGRIASVRTLAEADALLAVSVGGCSPEPSLAES